MLSVQLSQEQEILLKNQILDSIKDILKKWRGELWKIKKLLITRFLIVAFTVLLSSSMVFVHSSNNRTRTENAVDTPKDFCNF